jgi:hypothetical protein
MKNEYTNLLFWETSWKGQTNFSIPKSLFFEDYISNKNIFEKSMIEVGGYSGLDLIYFNKKFKCETTLLDYYIDEETYNRFKIENSLPIGSLRLIKSDFLKFNSEKN